MPLSLLGDARLIRLASRGDEAAFAAIFRRYHQPLYRYCRAITGNGEDASDALQNTMVKAMRALPGERRAIELKPWLFRVAHNESVSLLRRRPPDAELEPESVGPGADGPEAGLVSREELRELMSDLRELPDRQRAAVILRELNGLSYAEIGSVFETSTAAAKQAAYDGRVALQDYAKGRAMDCETVMRGISDGDGRSLRGRKSRGHLRSCAECASFKQALEARSTRLAAIAPALPATTAAALMRELLGGGGSAGGGSIGASAAGGKLLVGTGVLKSATAVVAAATVAAGAAAGGAQLARNDPAPHPKGEPGALPAPAVRGSDGDADQRPPFLAVEQPTRRVPATARRTTRAGSERPGRPPLGAGQGRNAAETHGPSTTPGSRTQRPRSPARPPKGSPPRTPRRPAMRRNPAPPVNRTAPRNPAPPRNSAPPPDTGPPQIPAPNIPEPPRAPTDLLPNASPRLSDPARPH